MCPLVTVTIRKCLQICHHKLSCTKAVINDVPHDVHTTCAHLAQVPCTPKVPACPNLAVPTGNAEGFWPYDRVAGRISFNADDIPFQKEAWGKLVTYSQKELCDNVNSVLYLQRAVHVCSYLCLSGKYVNDTANWCLLWPAEGDEASKAMYCMDRAVKSPFPMLNPLYPPK